LFRWFGLLLLAFVSLAAETHRLKPDSGHATFAERPPVLALKPGDKTARESGGAGVRLGDMPWTEAEKRLTADRVVVLPLGAGSKEHGPHLPLRTDAILADYFAQRVMEARPVVVLPALTYGFYPAFLEYPGSTSLSFETQRDAVAEICRSIARHGPRRFYVLNTGISTARPLKATEERLAADGILMRFTDLASAGRGTVDAVRQEKYGTHADEIETSMILYMERGAVRMDKAVADGAEERPGPLTRDRANPLGHYAPTGVFGDATLATRQKGQTVVEGMLGDILKEIDALAEAPAPRGTPRSPLDREGVASPP
jgi:creatinine amidohydrolase